MTERGDRLAEGKSAFTQYADGADQIQAKCACIRWDARECYTARHYRVVDDLDDREPPEWDDHDCECHCHDELRELEEDIWGPPE